MGEAYNREGEVIGRAVGETKREVFDKLIQKHPEAQEIRIRSGRPPDEYLTTQGDPPPDSAKDLEAHPWKHEPLLQFFTCDHLPEPLRLASAPFCDLAIEIARSYPRNPERTVALRKLLEAKDAAVRSFLYT